MKYIIDPVLYCDCHICGTKESFVFVDEFGDDDAGEYIPPAGWTKDKLFRDRCPKHTEPKSLATFGDILRAKLNAKQV